MSVCVPKPVEMPGQSDLGLAIPTFQDIAEMFLHDAGKANSLHEAKEALAWQHLMLACSEYYGEKQA